MGGVGDSPERQYVVYGRIPWDGVWLNRHYLSRELARRGENVVYVLDPLPARPSRRRAQLAAERESRIGSAEPAPGVSLVRLPELPLQRLSVLARASRELGERQIQAKLRPDVETVVILYPQARLPARGAFGEALTVYYCSDDFGHRPDGTRRPEVQEWEDEVLDRSDVVIVSTVGLEETMAPRHPRVCLVENGFDPDLFRPVEGGPPDDIAELPEPRIGFVGSVREALFDFELMSAVARARPDWSLCCIGWTDDADAGLAAFAALPNVHVLGPRPREELARYISAMAVVTAPYPPTKLAAPALPLKAFESLAVGAPLVGLHAPLLDGYRPHLRSAETLEAFLAEIDAVLADPPTGSVDAAAPFTWKCRAAELLAHFDAALDQA